MAMSRMWCWLREQAQHRQARRRWPWGKRRPRPCIEQLEDRILLDGTQSFPAPLDPLKPFGSLAFARSHADAIAGAGDTDTYTVPLDGGQVLTAVLRADDPSLQARLRLRDPGAATLAGADATTPGVAVVLQTVPVSGA